MNFNKDKITILDIYTLSMFFIYLILNIVLFGSLNNSILLLTENIGLITLIILIINLDNSKNKIFFLLHKIYPLLLLLLIYGQIQNYISVINPHTYDNILIKMDQLIFGVNPTEWLAKYSNPVLTEFLQITYFSFYILPIFHGYELYKNKEFDKYNKFAEAIFFTFFVSYLLYLAMPAIGPRFCIHEFSNISNELPGLFLTDFLREIINSGGGVPAGAENPALYVNKDCMPSGHTMVTLVNIILVFKNRSKFRYFVLIIGTSLIFATVYLRYHYVIDVIAGLILGILMIYIEPVLRNFINKIRKK